MRLDHLIASVPDIRATHARLLGLGFEEAWPPGPFWPAATNSGIALGGVNLELVQPDAGVREPTLETLVLAPESYDEGKAMLAGMAFAENQKEENDPTLLALRGFPPEMASKVQPICFNLYPARPPYPFFLCLYAPFLKVRLAPDNFAQPRGPIVNLSLVAPNPEAVRKLFADRIGSIGLDVISGERPEVAAIRFADGSRLSANDLEVRPQHRGFSDPSLALDTP